MRPASEASVTSAEDVPARNSSPRPRPAAVVALADVQAPIRERLEDVKAELRRIVDDDSPLIAGVSHHLLGMKGKLFRPTLVLLSSAATGDPQTTANTLAAVLELMHLATLVHDDAVDHSALRRGMPTLNALFSHQISVIAGDFLYLRALRELSRLGDLQALRVLTEASVEMTRGELRQLTYGDPLEFGERDYEALIGAKTAALFGAACEVGALCGAAEYRTELARYGERLGMAFQVIDDVLDYTSGQEVTGKPGGLDLRERKMTLPLIAAMRGDGSGWPKPGGGALCGGGTVRGGHSCRHCIGCRIRRNRLRVAPGCTLCPGSGAGDCRFARHAGGGRAPSGDRLCPRSPLVGS